MRYSLRVAGLICIDCGRQNTLRDSLCHCGRFLVTDRPLEYQTRRGSSPWGLVALGVLLEIGGFFAYAVRSEALAYQRHASKSQAYSDTQAILPVAEKWRVDHPAAACPTVAQLRDENELASSSKITDPWETTYIIDCRGDDTIARSAGPDRLPNTADDIISPDPDRYR